MNVPHTVSETPKEKIFRLKGARYCFLYNGFIPKDAYYNWYRNTVITRRMEFELFIGHITLNGAQFTRVLFRSISQTVDWKCKEKLFFKVGEMIYQPEIRPIYKTSWAGELTNLYQLDPTTYPPLTVPGGVSVPGGERGSFTPIIQARSPKRIKGVSMSVIHHSVSGNGVPLQQPGSNAPLAPSAPGVSSTGITKESSIPDAKHYGATEVSVNCNPTPEVPSVLRTEQHLVDIINKIMNRLDIIEEKLTSSGNLQSLSTDGAGEQRSLSSLGNRGPEGFSADGAGERCSLSSRGEALGVKDKETVPPNGVKPSGPRFPWELKESSIPGTEGAKGPSVPDASHLAFQASVSDGTKGATLPGAVGAKLPSIPELLPKKIVDAIYGVYLEGDASDVGNRGLSADGAGGLQRPLSSFLENKSVLSFHPLGSVPPGTTATPIFKTKFNFDKILDILNKNNIWFSPLAGRGPEGFSPLAGRCEAFSAIGVGEQHSIILKNTDLMVLQALTP
jgi:hypothetical protein